MRSGLACEQDPGLAAAADAADARRMPSRPPAAAAALARGEDPCAADDILDYNLPLHIGSVFILLAVSLAGSLGPVALSRLGSGKAGGRGSNVISTAITLGSLFGA